MAHKKVKSHLPANKKEAFAKQAYKKKQKSATKSKNDQLRESLDRQAQTVYETTQPIAMPLPVTTELQQDHSMNGLLKSLLSSTL